MSSMLRQDSTDHIKVKWFSELFGASLVRFFFWSQLGPESDKHYICLYRLKLFEAGRCVADTTALPKLWGKQHQNFDLLIMAESIS